MSSTPPSARLAASSCGCAAPSAATLWRWGRIGFSAVVAMNAMAVAIAVNTSEDLQSNPRAVRIGLLISTLLVGLLVGAPLVRGAWNALRERRLAVEFLFLLTLAGAFGVSLQSLVLDHGPVYFEVVSILLVVYAFGAELNLAARNRAIEAIRSLSAGNRMARVEVRAGEFEQRPASEVRAGELLEVLPGEMTPVDGILLSEGALFEEASVRGEFVPRPRAPGETVMAGSFVLDSQVRLRAVPPPGDSSLDSLLCEVGMGIDTRSRAQQMADRLARWFVPVVASVAAATFAGWSAFVPASEALFHAMAVLLVACPCALGFATPLALWTATSRLSTLGIRVSKASDVETLSTVDLVVFDKTGTLSAAGTHLSRIEWLDSAPYPPPCMEAMVVAAERDLHHPFARAMERSGMSARASGSGCDWVREELRILPGKGIWTRVREAQGAVHELEVISRSAMQERQVRSAGDGKRESGEEGIVFVLDGTEAGSASFEEEFRDGREAALDRFTAMGVELQLLSGDSHARVARTGIAAAQSSLSPTEKREKVAQWQRAKRKILFVGDGINDAPAMAAADIAIAVDEGAALARAVANGVWDGGNLEAIPAAVGIARQTVRRVRTNFRWAIGYNTAGMALAAAGLLHPVSAAVLMVASSAQVTWRAMALLGDTSIDALSAGARAEPASVPRGYLPAEREPSPSVRVTG